MESPVTLRDAILWFSEFEHCRQFMMELRWPDGVVRCPHCGSDNVTWLSKARVWKCYAKHARPTFTLKTGTIFEESPIPLEKWLPAAWMLIGCKNGISSYELSRDLGVTQKTAWFMLHRIRLAMQDRNTGGKLGGEVEVDETFIGGKARNMHKNVRERRVKNERGTAGKMIVMGMLERKGEIRAHVVPTNRRVDLQPHMRDHIEPGTQIFTDSHPSYEGMSEFEHQVIDHAVAYVQGNVHTNGLENFWSLLKRGLHGTYVSVEPYHLFRYVDEQAFRFNNRKDENGDPVGDAERFAAVMKQIVGRRLTYAELTGKAGDQGGMRP